MAGIYIHIPFCKQACNYCNFHFSTSLSQKEKLLDAMQKEIALNRSYLGDAVVETIYLGGGTPSLLSAEELKRLFGALETTFPNQHLKEATLEANPDDIDRKYLQALKSTPVNRFSIGIQSFRDDDLQFMHRAHNAGEADYAIKAAQDAGFDNISIDLIYGTPGLSDAGWEKNIAYAQMLHIPHISAYALTLESGTALAYSVKAGKARSPDQQQAADQFEILMEEMEAGGYEHYEISNFAKGGKYAVHNTNYWRGNSYLGIGPSAHSFNGVSRQWNVANNALYIKSLLAEHKLAFEKESLSPINQLNEYIMTSLRTMWGLNLQHTGARFGVEFQKALSAKAEVFISQGQMLEKDDTLILSRQGKLFADAIASEMFFDER